MELKDVGSGQFPDFGAIFMSNHSTLKECFERKLFGLPACFSDFVRGVKTGMILFLYEYEERKLYGVFKATSDGMINIVPHAYSSSGRQFPAQVRITTIWQCYPLRQHEFRYVIRDNYFDKSKFKFGLSKDQVHGLLLFFNLRKVEVPKSPSFTKRERKRRRKHSNEEVELEKGRSMRSESSEGKINIKSGMKSVISTGDADLSNSNLNPLACSDRVTLVKKDSPLACDSCFSSGGFDVTFKQPERAPCDHTYNPEFPGFQYSSVLGTGQSSASGHEYSILDTHASEKHPVIVREESEKLNTSSRSFSPELGDFIPLASPDYSDFAEAGVPSSEDGGSENNETESDTFEGHKDLFLSESVVPIVRVFGGESFRQENFDHPFAASNSVGGPCSGTVESSSFGWSLSNLGDCHLKDSADYQEQSELDYGDGHPHVKVMYSDIQNKRVSVFSRLNLTSKGVVQENKDNTRVNISAVNEIMEEFQQRHDRLRKMVKEAKSLERENEDCNTKKRNRVFSRISIPSETVGHDNANTRRLHWGTGELKRTTTKAFTVQERKDNSSVYKYAKNSLEILGSKCTVQEKEDSSREGKSVQQRHGKWREMVRKGDSLGQQNEDHCEKKRLSVFSRLTRASEAVIQDKDKTIGLQQGKGKLQKRNQTAKASFQERKDNIRVDKSVDKSLETLEANDGHWKTERESKISIRNHDSVENCNKSTPMEIIECLYPSNEGHLEDRWSPRMEGSCLNVKCSREKSTKIQTEIEGSGCADGVQNSSSDKNQHNKRLVKPLSDNKSSYIKIFSCDSCPSLGMPSQESSAGKENSGSCKALVKADRIDADEIGLSHTTSTTSNVSNSL